MYCISLKKKYDNAYQVTSAKAKLAHWASEPNPPWASLGLKFQPDDWT